MTRGEEGPAVDQPAGAADGHDPTGSQIAGRHTIVAATADCFHAFSGWLPDIVWNKAVDVPEQVPQRLGCCSLDAAVAADRQADDNLVDLRRHRRGGARAGRQRDPDLRTVEDGGEPAPSFNLRLRKALRVGRRGELS